MHATSAALLILALSVNFCLPTISAFQGSEEECDRVPIDWSRYHDYEDLTRILLMINDTYSQVARVFSIGRSYLGREIWVVRLTDDKSSLRKSEILVVGYHHARELISAEAPLYLVDYVVRHSSSNHSISELLRRRIIYVVVALNVDGLEAVKENPWQRKNLRPTDDDLDGLVDEDLVRDMDGDGRIGEWTELRLKADGEWAIVARGLEGVDLDGDGPAPYICTDVPGGVDLNRNYDYQWNDMSVQSGSANPSSDVYRGPEAFSEPETRALRDFTLQHTFKAAISFHSGTSVILYPWSHKKATTSDDLTFRVLANRLSQVTGSPYQRSSEMYTLSGDWKDWTYSTFGTYAFTIELYGNSQAYKSRTLSFDEKAGILTMWTTGVFEAYNPPLEAIEKISSSGAEAAIALALFPDFLIQLTKPAVLICIATIAVSIVVVAFIARRRSHILKGGQS